MQKFHEILLDYLLKDKSLRFTLRKERANNEEKFSRGYWFLGNDGFLNVSFWNAQDGINKTPNIFLGIAQNKIWLECVDRSGGEKAAFFADIAPLLDLRKLQTKHQDRWLWEKTYPFENDYDSGLKQFLQKDKPIIDVLIHAKGKSHLFPPIAQDVFEKDLNYILSRRKVSVTEKKPNIPIRLKKVVLNNIAHFDNIEINVDKQVTCFIGENGSGKTSILQAIALCLAGISGNNVIEPSANEGAIKNMLRIHKVEGAQEIFVANGQIEVVYNSNQHNFTNFKFIKGETVLETGRIIRDPIEVDDAGSDATITEDNFFKDLIIGFSQIKANRNRSEKANPEKRPRISEVTALIYKLEDESFNYFQDWLLGIWAETTSDTERQVKIHVLKDIFNVIGRIVGNGFEWMPMQINQSQVFIKTAEAVNGIPMRLISQGYYNVIGWVGYFMQRLWEVWTISPHYAKVDFKQSPALVLIGEIDTCLHPKWQYYILQVLVETFPNVQFIVTTHSPYVVGSIPNDKIQIYICQKKGSETQVVPFEDIAVYGSKLDFVNQMVFNTPSRIESVATIISQMRASIQRSDFEQVEVLKQKLENIGVIISTDPEISSLISLANTKRKIAKA